jgi:hypothetical protein
MVEIVADYSMGSRAIHALERLLSAESRRGDSNP